MQWRRLFTFNKASETSMVSTAKKNLLRKTQQCLGLPAFSRYNLVISYTLMVVIVSLSVCLTYLSFGQKSYFRNLEYFVPHDTTHLFQGDTKPDFSGIKPAPINLPRAHSLKLTWLEPAAKGCWTTDHWRSIKTQMASPLLNTLYNVFTDGRRFGFSSRVV